MPFGDSRDLAGDDSPEWRERLETLRAEEAPLVETIRATGINILGIMGLTEVVEPFSSAVPELLHFLEHEACSNFMVDEIGAALTAKNSGVEWDELVSLYFNLEHAYKKEVIASVLSMRSRKRHGQRLVEILADRRWGDDRVYFIPPVLRYGGPKGRAVVGLLVDDPVLGHEARRRLAKLRSR